MAGGLQAASEGVVAVVGGALEDVDEADLDPLCVGVCAAPAALWALGTAGVGSHGQLLSSSSGSPQNGQ